MAVGDRFPSIYVPPVAARGIMPTPVVTQPSLYPIRIGIIYPRNVNGADICYTCHSEQGELYYCKDDKDGRIIRATEWFSTNLARHLNIATADCAVLEEPNSGQTVFGSRHAISSAASFDAKNFLSIPLEDELGQPGEWIGRYLSGLYAFDLFLNNPDRGFQNFLLLQHGINRQLCAIDFASAQLGDLAGTNFPVASTHTVFVGRFCRQKHGFYPESAFEMIRRLAAVPPQIIAGFLDGMPDDWMTSKQREGICEHWSGNGIEGRLAALRSGIADESLL